MDILSFHSQKTDEYLSESYTAYGGVDFKDARVEDEVFSKYGIESEEIAACYEKFKCEKNPVFEE